jgi:hypothetical protein
MTRGKSFSMLAAVALAAFVCAIPASFSAPMVWQLRDVKFGDGGSAHGSFTYDATIGKILDWSITATGHGGTTFGAPIDISFVDVLGCNDPACDTAQRRLAGGLPPQEDFVFNHGATPASSAFLSLIPVRPLTNDPGIASLIAGSASGGSYLSCCEAGVQAYLVSGVLDSAPEPASVLCMLAGIAALAGMQWFRRRSPKQAASKPR